MVLWNALRLLEVFERKGFNELGGNLGGLDQSRNNIDAVETNVRIEDGFKIVPDDGIVAEFDQEADSDKRIVVDQEDQILRSKVKVEDSIRLIFQATVDFSRFIFRKMAF